MATLYTPDHPGQLTIESRGDVTLDQLANVPKHEAEAILERLARREMVSITAPDGSLYVVDGLAVIAAKWEPNR